MKHGDRNVKCSARVLKGHRVKQADCERAGRPQGLGHNVCAALYSLMIPKSATVAMCSDQVDTAANPQATKRTKDGGMGVQRVPNSAARVFCWGPRPAKIPGSDRMIAPRTRLNDGDVCRQTGNGRRTPAGAGSSFPATQQRGSRAITENSKL